MIITVSLNRDTVGNSKIDSKHHATKQLDGPASQCSQEMVRNALLGGKEAGSGGRVSVWSPLSSELV